MATKKESNIEIEDREFNEQESNTQIRMNENDLIAGILGAANFVESETQLIQIIRDDKVFFEFYIHPLSEAMYDKCKRRHTKYVRNKQLGIKFPEDTDNTKYRCELIYCATTDEYQRKLWNNKKVMDGLDVVAGIDTIDKVLLSGEKDKIIDAIDALSGYDSSNLEDVAKN